MEDGKGMILSPYPRLSRTGSGSSKASCALVDHLRSIDKRRIRRLYGALPASELAAIDEAFRLVLGLSRPSAG